MAKRRRYSDDFRASAIIMLESQGYPGTLGALSSVADHLNVSVRTLRRWWLGTQNPPPAQLVQQKKGELSEMLSELLQAFVKEMFDAAPDANLQQLATAFGIAFDKLQLLKGQPTERHEHISHSERLDRLTAIFDAARERGGLPTAGRTDSAIH